MISDTLDQIEQPAVENIAIELEGARPPDVLRWSYDEFGSDVAMATGFGIEGCVLISMLAETGCDIRLFYLDTDLLFPETYALRDTLEARYDVRFERRATSLSLDQQSTLYGDKLWERQPDECCRLRKVEPLRQMLAGLRAWITGIRRDQSATRANARVVEHDRQFGLIKINPLVAWSAKDVWEYAKRNDVPHNPLLDQGYGSIGCRPCTTPIQIGEDQRAGRWRGKSKTECGIHLKVVSPRLTEQEK